MPDSNPSDPLAQKQERNSEERLEGILRWVEYIREQPPEVWGEQQNRLVNSQLESARESSRSPDQERRIRAFAEAAVEAAEDTDDS